MFRNMINKKRALVLGIVAALAVAGIAVAYFTSSGSGNGSASVGKSTAFTVTVSSDSSEALLPGSGSETLTYTVTNPSSGHQNLSKTSATVAQDGSGNILSGKASVSGCKASWFTAANTAPTLGDLGGGATATGGKVVVEMKNEAVSQDACQGKSPEITVTAE